ncbi:MAG: Gfo/Idh/MocA family protein [Verrucomicrobiia bacterium]
MIKVAIIGAGAISDSHINGYLKFQDRCKIVAIADISKEKAQKKIQDYGLQATAYSSYTELIENEKFDAASVCLPPFEHAPAAIALLNSGKDVLCEKPMAPSLEECDRMIASAKDNKRLLSVVAQNRFRTPVMRAKSILESGITGRILFGRADSLWWRGSNYYDLWWRGTWEKEGGGCTINHAVHHIDLFLWLMGMPASVIAFTENLNHINSEVEDFSTAVLFYNDKRIGQITSSLIHHGEEQQLIFQCEQAGVSIPWRVSSYRQRVNGFPEEDTQKSAQIQSMYDSLPEVKYTAHDGQIANFLAAIEGKESLIVDGEQGRNTIMLITAVYLSAHLGERVYLPLDKNSLFYTKEGIIKNAKKFHTKTKSVDNFSDSKITFGREF